MLLLGMEFTQELSHAVYFQIQCVESKLYPHTPPTPQKQWVSAVEMHRGSYKADAAMALVEKNNASSAVISSLGQWPSSTEKVAKFMLCT